MSVLYFTHCSKKKDDSLRGSNLQVSPRRLYTATYLQRFIERCEREGVNWAIFSDRYGFIFPDDEIEWYEHSPDDVTGYEKQGLFKNALGQLEGYERVYFYHNPGRFHRLYRELFDYLRARGIDIKLISHLTNIQ